MSAPTNGERRRPLRETAVRSVVGIYAALLAFAGWPANLRPEAVERASLAVHLLVLDRVGISPGRPVFSGTVGLPRWWTTHLCLEVSARTASGESLSQRAACPGSGLRLAWNPVDSMLYHWLIEARGSRGRRRGPRLGAGVDWFCQPERWDGRRVTHVRIESVEGEIDYETGDRREQRTLEVEGACG